MICVNLRCVLVLYYLKLALLLEYQTEFCQLETFQPKCSGSNEVVLIASATYGRMEVGKCITREEISGVYGQDPKYFGCKSDVLELLHSKCSLKPTCEIKIPNADLDKTKPCLPGLRFYLQVAYTCINVVDHDANCVIQASTMMSKHFTLKGLLNNTICGTKIRPWIVESSRGQKLQVSFASLKSKTDQQTHATCGYEIGTFNERGSTGLRNVTFCSSGKFLSRNSAHLISDDGMKLTSSGSVVEFVVGSQLKDYLANEKSYIGMLLKIDADGCLDIIPPEDTWLKRNGDDIVIGCYSSKQTWYLRCENKRWSGTIGNCSSANNVVKDDNKIKTLDELPNEHMKEEQQILIMVAICGVGVVICSAIICVGAVCLKRLTKKRLADNLYMKQPIYYPTVNGESLSKAIHSGSYSNQENKCLEPSAGYEASLDYNNKENNYFILEEGEKNEIKTIFLKSSSKTVIV